MHHYLLLHGRHGLLMVLGALTILALLAWHLVNNERLRHQVTRQRLLLIFLGCCCIVDRLLLLVEVLSALVRTIVIQRDLVLSLAESG